MKARACVRVRVCVCVWVALSLSLSLALSRRLRREVEDLEAQDPSDGCRPLHAAILTEQTEAASYLIRHGGHRGHAGRCLRTSESPLCLFFVETRQRADLESRAFEGLTPLLLACRSDAGRPRWSFAQGAFTRALLGDPCVDSL